MNTRAKAQEVHPVLIITVGTTTTEVALLLRDQCRSLRHPVPFKTLSLDSLDYPSLTTRLEQNGWTKDSIASSIPRQDYLRLENPFKEDFDFDAPLAREWNDTLFEPTLKRIAQKPSGPGCGGTPAFGRAWMEYLAQAIRDRIEETIQNLTRVNQDTVALKPGVLVFILTSARGGTGSGATAVLGGLARSVLPEGSQLHLRVFMPCVYQSDQRAHANAYAMLRELQHYHREGGHIPIKGGKKLPPAFDTVTPIFASNEAVTLGPRDGLTQLAAVLRNYISSPTQATINARRVDLTDVMAHDHEGRPMHITQELALSVRVVSPGTLEYIASRWIYLAIFEANDRFNAWCESRFWHLDEKNRVKAISEIAIEVLHLDLKSFLARLEPAVSPINKLRSLIEQVRAALPNMKSETIKSQMFSLPGKIKELFNEFDGVWYTLSWELSQKLTQEITDYLKERFPLEPHLVLATGIEIRNHLANLIPNLRQSVENAKGKRDKLGAEIGTALGAVATPKGGLLSWVKRDEHTREAAQKALGVIFAASIARIEQERLEYLVEALAGDVRAGNLKGYNRWGTQITTPSLMTALERFEADHIIEVRDELSRRLNEARNKLAVFGQRIEKRSPIFERSLLFDGATRAALDQEASEAYQNEPHPKPIERHLLGASDLDETLKDLLEVLPSASKSAIPLTEHLIHDESKRHSVTQLVRKGKPFTPANRVVEDQQGLIGRRDTLSVLEIPGGSASPLATFLVREGIVSRVDDILDSGEDELRWLMLRDGLPYSALKPLATKYARAEREYLSRPGAITPYTQADAPGYADFTPPRVSVITHATRLLLQLQTLTPERLETHPTRGFTLRYERDNGYGAFIEDNITFPTMMALVRWVVVRPDVRHQLDAQVKTALDQDFEGAITALTLAWQRTDNPDREHLKEVLFSLGHNPRLLVERIG